MAQTCLYLDMDHAGISCRLSGSLDQGVTVRYEDLPKTDGDIPRFNAAVGLLPDRLNLSGCTRAVVTVPPDWVWFRHTSLPFRQANKINQVIQMELAPALPVQDIDLVLDFYVLDARFEPDQYLIFSAVIEEERIKEIFAGLAAIGITPAVVTPRGYAQAVALLPGQTEHRDFLHIHKSPSETTLVFVMNGQPTVVRTLKAGNKGPAPEQAAGMVKEIRACLRGAGCRLGLEPEAFIGLPILMTGDDNGLDTWADHLNTALASAGRNHWGPVSLVEARPWQELITPDRSPAYLFNFCKGRYRSGSFLTRYKGHLIACFTLAAVAFGLAVFDLHIKNAELENQINRIRGTALDIYRRNFPESRLGAGHAPLMLMESKVKQARQSRTGDENNVLGPGPRIRVMEILKELSVRIPPGIDMEFTRLALNHNRLVLTGVTPNFNDVDRVKGLIQASPRFRNVSIQSAETDKTGKQVRFKFIVEI